MKTFILYIFLFTILLSGCKNEKIIPKPYGYMRFDLPDKEYKLFEKNDYPYSFDIPTYSSVEKDKAYDTQKYWINICFPSLNGKIYISYKQVDNNLRNLTDDAHKLAYKHTQIAEAIRETQFSNPSRSTYGLIYEIIGNTASPIQFFVTDNTKNFIRGSLYFNCKPNKDSLSPVINYIHKDIIRLMESIEWQH